MITKFIDICIQKNLIELENKELYEYGLKQGLFSILNIFTAFFISVLLGMVWQNLVFIACYMPLRMNVGGYHTRTQWSCYVLSTIIIFISLILIKWDAWMNVNFFAILIISSMLLILISPIEDENKPISELEKKVYKKRVYIILSVYVMFSSTFWIIGYIQISISILISIFLSSFLLMIGYIKLLIEEYS